MAEPRHRGHNRREQHETLKCTVLVLLGLGMNHGFVGAVPRGQLTNSEFKSATWGECFGMEL